jgi:flagellar biosynthesis/type III secretory pathway protein FliH
MGNEYLTAEEEAYEKGYEDGYESGKQTGYDIGYKDGLKYAKYLYERGLYRNLAWGRKVES